MEKTDKLEDAIECFENSLYLMNQIGDAEGICRAGRNLTVAYSNLGNTEQAYYYGAMTMQLLFKSLNYMIRRMK